MKSYPFQILLVALVLLGLSLACNLPINGASKPSVAPMSEEDLQRLQDEMAKTLTSSSGGITITITEQQINSIIAAKMNEQPEPILSEPSVVLTKGNMEVSGKIFQGNFSPRIKMVLQPAIDSSGIISLKITEISVGGIPAPQELQDQIGNLIDLAFQEYLNKQQGEFQVTNITIEDGKMTITGNVP